MAAAFAGHMLIASVWFINIPQLGHARTDGTLEPYIRSDNQSLPGLLHPEQSTCLSVGPTRGRRPKHPQSLSRTILVTPRPSHVAMSIEQGRAADPLLLNFAVSTEATPGQCFRFDV